MELSWLFDGGQVWAGLPKEIVWAEKRGLNSANELICILRKNRKWHFVVDFARFRQHEA